MMSLNGKFECQSVVLVIYASLSNAGHVLQIFTNHEICNLVCGLLPFSILAQGSTGCKAGGAGDENTLAICRSSLALGFFLGAVLWWAHALVP